MKRRIFIANRRARALWWRLPVAAVVWSLWAVPLVAGLYGYLSLRGYARDLPRIPDLANWRERLPESSRIVARDGTVLAVLPFTDGDVVGHRRYVSLAEVPDVVVDAFLAAEDVRFFAHRGVDFRAVARAARANYRAGRVVEGASTITQQLARGLLPNELGTERKLRRKIREALVALRLERHYDKRAILEAYLNHVFLGSGAYGVAAAARAYWDKELGELELAEAALLAGLAQAPGRADPNKDLEAALTRRNEVLERMSAAGLVTGAAARAAADRPIDLSPPRRRYGSLAPWHTERVRQELEALGEVYENGGLDIVSAAEPAQTLAAEFDSERWLRRLWHDAARAPQLAVISWDHRTGYVEVTIGGRSFAESKFDRATQACRQPGSAFKPVVYGAAIERDAIAAGTPLRDAPIAEFDWRLGVHWKPDTAGRSFRGVVLAVDALASSLNAPAVDVLDRVGAKAAIAFAKRVGIDSALDPVRPLALGASCVVGLELARFYAIVASGGRRVDPVFAVRASRRGELLFDRSSPFDPYLTPSARFDRFSAASSATIERVVDEDTAFILRWMLRQVVTRGTGRDARGDRPELAGKTGTTNDNTDAWFVGMSPRIVASVWLGFDDPAVSLGRRRDGGRAALPLWRKVVAAAESGRGTTVLVGEPPQGIVMRRVDRGSGLLARPAAGNAMDVYYRRGTEPTSFASKSGVLPEDVGRMTSEF